MEIDFKLIGETAAAAMEMVEREYGDEEGVKVLEVAVGIIVEYRKDGDEQASGECCTRFSNPHRFIQLGIIEEMKMAVIDGEDADSEEEKRGDSGSDE